MRSLSRGVADAVLTAVSETDRVAAFRIDPVALLALVVAFREEFGPRSGTANVLQAGDFSHRLSDSQRVGI